MIFNGRKNEALQLIQETLPTSLYIIFRRFNNLSLNLIHRSANHYETIVKIHCYKYCHGVLNLSHFGPTIMFRSEEAMDDFENYDMCQRCDSFCNFLYFSAMCIDEPVGR